MMSDFVKVFLIPDLSRGNFPSKSQISDWVNFAYMGADSASVNIKIVDESESSMLNEQYLQKSGSTNVLSFPMHITEEDGSCMLGDIAICAAVIKKEATEQQKSLESHWAHMVIHGMLHLQGYDHVIEEDALKMESLEKKIMNKLGFDDPY